MANGWRLPNVFPSESAIGRMPRDELHDHRQIYNHAAQLRSFEVAAAVRDEIDSARSRKV